MNTEQLVSLFQSVNRGTVSLVDSLSVLSAVSELNNVKVEIELHSGMLNVLLKNLEIESAALFLVQDDTIQLITTAAWEQAAIVTRHRQDEWQSFDVKWNESAVGKTAASRKIRYQKCRQLPEFFTQVADKEDQRDVVGIRAHANALMYVPLTLQETVMGVLCLHYNLNESVISTLDQFMPLFARFYVQALTNFRYINDLQGQIEARTQQLKDALRAAGEPAKGAADTLLADSKAGLPSLRYFCKESSSSLACAIRYRRAFSCCVIEISQGYNSSVYEALADILKMQVRETDILAHLGDRQFVLSLPEIGADEARQFGQRIINVMKELAADVELFSAVELRIGLATRTETMTGSTETVLDDLINLAGQTLTQGVEQTDGICHIMDSQNPHLEVTGTS